MTMLLFLFTTIYLAIGVVVFLYADAKMNISKKFIEEISSEEWKIPIPPRFLMPAGLIVMWPMVLLTVLSINFLQWNAPKAG